MTYSIINRARFHYGDGDYFDFSGTILSQWGGGNLTNGETIRPGDPRDFGFSWDNASPNSYITIREAQNFAGNIADNNNASPGLTISSYHDSSSSITASVEAPGIQGFHSHDFGGLKGSVTWNGSSYAFDIGSWFFSNGGIDLPAAPDDKTDDENSSTTDSKDLGLVIPTDTFKESGQVSPEQRFAYTFQVSEEQTLYSQFSLTDFEDDLDLELWEWNSSNSSWDLIAYSELPENQDESLFQILDAGTYSIDIYNFEDLNNNEAPSDYILTIDNDAWILDFDVDLGLLESNAIYSDTNQVADDDAYIYNFQVAESETLYSEINLGNFQDDLDLELWEWNNISNNWELLASSESPENQDESIFKVIGPGQYSIDIKNYADLDDNNAPSGYDLEIDNQSWLSTVAIPDDPLFTNQWHLFNTGQGTGSDNIDIYAPEAWGLRSTSPSTTVAIIDGGVDLNHEDLINNLWINTDEIANNNIDDDNNGYIDDIHGWDFSNNAPLSIADNHGTHVAGTVGAEGNNGIGVSGVTWDVNLMSLDVFGRESTASSTNIWQAIYYAVDHGADIINMSLGATYNLSTSEYIEENLEIHNRYLDALNYAVDNGTTVVIAAGNEQTNFDQGWISTPAYFSELIDGVISVAAIANSGQRASYSNYGSEVTIGAPGGDINISQNIEDGIFSTFLTAESLYGYAQGTSMAAPVVSGTIALMHEENANLTPAEIESILQSSSKHNRSLEGFILNGATLDTHEAVRQARATKEKGEISLSKTVSSDQGANEAGDVIEYKIVVSNTGTQSLTDIEIDDPKTNLRQTVDTLAPGESKTFIASYTLTSLDISTNGGGDGAIENTVVASSTQANTVTSTAVHSLKIQTTTSINSSSPSTTTTVSNPETDNNDESSEGGRIGGGGGSSSGDASLPNSSPSSTGSQDPAPAPQAQATQPSAPESNPTTELLLPFPINDQPVNSFEDIPTPKKISIFELKKPLEVSNQRLVTLIAGTNKKDKIIGSVSGEIIAGGEGKDVISGGGGADGFLFQDPDGFGKKEADKIQDFNADEGDSILIDNQAFNLNRKVKFKATAGKNAIKKASKSKRDFIYNERKGLLYFNENGKERGWGDGGLFAKLAKGTDLDANDVNIV